MQHTGNKNLFFRIQNALLDLLFPKKCLGCKQEGCFLCADCFAGLEVGVEKKCAICGREILNLNQICENCRPNFLFDSIWSASHYQGLIKELISALKFDYIEEIAEGLARHFVRAIDKAGLADKLKGQIITPVPLHKKRYLERGFNQSELISAKIAELLGMKLARGALLRIKNTRQQSKLNKSERIENMREAFSATLAPAPEFVFLFDDVFTTGQTTNEAAKALKIAGVKQVHVLAIAQGR